jgi:hypothetical protein
MSQEAKREAAETLQRAIYDDEFFTSLPPDSLDAAAMIAEQFFTAVDKWDETIREKRSAEFIQAMQALRSFSKAHGLDLHNSSPPELSDNPAGNANAVLQWFGEARKKIAININKRTLTHAMEHYDQVFAYRHVIELDDSEIERIQSLINEMRNTLNAAKAIDEKHKERLLQRLERLQSELHKRMSNVDRFWGFLGDMGVALGKFGKDAEPLFAQARKMLEIIYGAQRRQARLPGPAQLPQLPDFTRDE